MFFDMIKIEESTYEDQVKMYSKIKKEKLVTMLIEANRLLDIKYRPTIDQMEADLSHRRMLMRQNGQ